MLLQNLSRFRISRQFSRTLQFCSLIQKFESKLQFCRTFEWRSRFSIGCKMHGNKEATTKHVIRQVNEKRSDLQMTHAIVNVKPLNKIYLDILLTVLKMNLKQICRLQRIEQNRSNSFLAIGSWATPFELYDNLTFFYDCTLKFMFHFDIYYHQTPSLPGGGGGVEACLLNPNKGTVEEIF